jgi:uncharacterized OsmC-like protein
MKDKREFQLKAKVFWQGGLKTQSIIRGFEVETDEPKSHFGTNTAPAPVEIFISSIGACLLTTYAWSIMKARVVIQDCTVDVKAHTVEKDKSEKVSKAMITLTVWGDKKDKKKLEQCFDISKKFCTLTNSVSFPMDIIMHFKEEK